MDENINKIFVDISFKTNFQSYRTNQCQFECSGWRFDEIKNMFIFYNVKTLGFAQSFYSIVMYDREGVLNINMLDQSKKGNKDGE